MVAEDFARHQQSHGLWTSDGNPPPVAAPPMPGQHASRQQVPGQPAPGQPAPGQQGRRSPAAVRRGSRIPSRSHRRIHSIPVPNPVTRLSRARPIHRPGSPTRRTRTSRGRPRHRPLSSNRARRPEGDFAPGPAPSPHGRCWLIRALLLRPVDLFGGAKCCEVAGAGEHDREEEGLGDLSGGGPLFGVADVECPAFEAAVRSLVVCL